MTMHRTLKKRIEKLEHRVIHKALREQRQEEAKFLSQLTDAELDELERILQEEERAQHPSSEADRELSNLN